MSIRAFAGAAALAAALATPGCVTPKGADAGGRLGDPAESERAFRVASAEWLPLTRWTTGEDGARVIEAHLELRDAWGHGVKALGELRVELRRSAERASASSLGEPLLRWVFDLTDPEVNSTGYYDEISRAYVVTLGLRGDVSRAVEYELIGIFTALDGARFTTTQTLDPIRRRRTSPGAEEPRPEVD